MWFILIALSIILVGDKVFMPSSLEHVLRWVIISCNRGWMFFLDKDVSADTSWLPSGVQRDPRHFHLPRLHQQRLLFKELGQHLLAGAIAWISEDLTLGLSTDTWGPCTVALFRVDVILKKNNILWTEFWSLRRTLSCLGKSVHGLKWLQ